MDDNDIVKTLVEQAEREHRKAGLNEITKTPAHLCIITLSNCDERLFNRRSNKLKARNMN